MKNLITLTLGLFITVTVIAQDTATVEGPCKYDGMASLNFSQDSLSNAGSFGLEAGKKNKI